MNNIITTEARTPIEVALEIDENGLISAKKVYNFLGLDPNNYARWCKSNIIKNKYAIENEDYFPFIIHEECGGQSTTEYLLSPNLAKKICMISQGKNAEAARDYFIGCEQGLKIAIIKMNNYQIQVSKEINDLKNQLSELQIGTKKTKKEKPIPNDKLSKRGIMFQKRIKRLSNYLYKDGIKGISLKDTISYLIKEMREKFGINFNAYVKAYKKEYKIKEMPFRMFVVDHYDELSDYFERILDYVDNQHDLSADEIMDELYVD